MSQAQGGKDNLSCFLSFAPAFPAHTGPTPASTDRGSVKVLPQIPHLLIGLLFSGFVFWVFSSKSCMTIYVTPYIFGAGGRILTCVSAVEAVSSTLVLPGFISSAVL